MKEREHKRGELRCEKSICGGMFCGKPAKDYRRKSKREIAGWPDKNMPIALCEKHAKGHFPVSYSFEIFKEKLFSLRAVGLLSLLLICACNTPSVLINPVPVTVVKPPVTNPVVQPPNLSVDSINFMDKTYVITRSQDFKGAIINSTVPVAVLLMPGVHIKHLTVWADSLAVQCNDRDTVDQCFLIGGLVGGSYNVIENCMIQSGK